METRVDRRNHYFFGLCTIGRDMFYTMVSMFVMYYMTEVLNILQRNAGNYDSIADCHALL